MWSGEFVLNCMWKNERIICGEVMSERDSEKMENIFLS